MDQGPRILHGYLIDPFTRTIEPVQFTDHKSMAAFVDVGDGTDLTRVNGNGDMVLVDDLGFYRREQKFFLFRPYRGELPGKALLFGCDRYGETCSAHSSWEDVMGCVVWLP